MHLPLEGCRLIRKKLPASRSASPELACSIHRCRWTTFYNLAAVDGMPVMWSRSATSIRRFHQVFVCDPTAIPSRFTWPGTKLSSLS
jgi:hypothetical protein